MEERLADLLGHLGVATVRGGVERATVVDGHVDVLVDGLLGGGEVEALTESLDGREDVSGGLRGDQVHLTVREGLDHGHGVLVVAEGDLVDRGHHVAGVVRVLLKGQVLVLDEVHHDVGAGGEVERLVLGEGVPELVAGVPELRDRAEGRGVVVLEGVDEGLGGLGRVVDLQRVHRRDVRGDADAQVDLPVTEGLRVDEGDGLAVLGDLRELLDQADGVGGEVEVDAGLDLVGVGDLTGLRVHLLLDRVEVARERAPRQQQVRCGDGGAVRPVDALVDRVGHGERVVRGLLVGAEGLVADEVQVPVVVVETALHEVQDVGVRGGVTGRAVRVVLVEALVPADGHRAGRGGVAGLGAGGFAAAVTTVAGVRRAARRESERAGCGNRSGGSKSPHCQSSSCWGVLLMPMDRGPDNCLRKTIARVPVPLL